SPFAVLGDLYCELGPHSLEQTTAPELIYADNHVWCSRFDRFSISSWATLRDGPRFCTRCRIFRQSPSEYCGRLRGTCRNLLKKRPNVSITGRNEHCPYKSRVELDR